MDIEIKEFLLGNYFLFFYALGLLISVVTYKKYYNSILKYLPIIIAYTLVSEILGLIIRENDEIRLVYADEYAYYNNLIFNIFDIIFFLYFYYVFWKAIPNSKPRKWIKYGAMAFVVGSLINPFIQDFILYPQIWASSIGSIALIACIIFYLKELRLKSYTPNSQNLLFWISLGLLIFYSFYPLILLIGHFDYELYQKIYVRRIHHLLIAVMYACFITGFLHMKQIWPQKA